MPVICKHITLHITGVIKHLESRREVTNSTLKAYGLALRIGKSPHNIRS